MEKESLILPKDKEKSFLILSTNFKESGFKNTEYIFCVFNNGSVIRYINNKRLKICKLPKKEIDNLKFFLLNELNIFNKDFKKDNDLIKINHFDIDINIGSHKKSISENKDLYRTIEIAIDHLIVLSLKNYNTQFLSIIFDNIFDIIQEKISNSINNNPN